jgi:uncharacterized protein
MAPVSTRATMMWLVWTISLLLSSALHGCDSAATPTPVVNGGTTNVTIAGKVFKLDVAADDKVRYKGLGGRDSIPEDGGMIFTFPRSSWQVMGFVMRDCPIDIDILYLDGSGRVLTACEMKKEPPRDPAKGEGQPGELNVRPYEDRLKQYSSRFPCSFAVELKAGSIKKLGVKEGDKLLFDVEGLKAIAK